MNKWTDSEACALLSFRCDGKYNAILTRKLPDSLSHSSSPNVGAAVQMQTEQNP